MTKFSETLSEKLLQYADKNSISQEALAEKCNVSTRYIGNIIRRHQIPTIDVFEKICEGLDMTPDKLLLPEQGKGTQNDFLVCPACHSVITQKNTKYCYNCGYHIK